MNSRILIVGSNGYIGKHLTQELQAQGFQNVILTDIQDSSFFNDVNYHKWDIQKKDGHISDIIKDCDYVFFLAGITGTINSIDNYDKFISINEIGLLNLLNIFEKYNRDCKVIFPSTRLVYKGKKNVPLKEDDEKECKTIYAINKYSCENYLKIFQQCYGIRYTVFRICVPYGNTIDDNLSYGTISHFLKKAKAKESIIVFGGGSQKRTFTHISDLTKIITKGSFHKKTDNEIFNIGGPDRLSILEVAKQIAEVYSVPIEFKNWSEIDRILESGDTIFDSSKLETILDHHFAFNFDKWAESLLHSV